MSQEQPDVLVIGGGPAGYAAAIRAAQLGLDTVCVDDRGSAGGTCLHVGCIPSKALLSSTERLLRAWSEFDEHGLVLGGLEVDLGTMQRRKSDVVDTLTGGVDALLEKHGVRSLEGRAALEEAGGVRVAHEVGEDLHLEPRCVVLATGSQPTTLPDLPLDEETILSSTGALELTQIPEQLAVIGGGYIGVELGSVWSRLGAEVTIVEQEDRLLPGMDGDLAEQIERDLESQGLALRLGHTVDAVDRGDRGLRLSLRERDADAEGAETLACSHVLVAVGREPALDGLGLEAAGVERTEGGFVRVDSCFRTTRAGILAVGDVVGEPMLAHKARLEAVACVDALVGRGSGFVDYDAVPAVVYTWPELASLGSTEAALREADIPYRVGRASFEHDARALCTGEGRGFVKLLAEEGSDRLLGAHIAGPHAGSLVHELVLTHELSGSLEELGRAAHAHPTLNEAIREAALALHGRAIHR